MRSTLMALVLGAIWAFGVGGMELDLGFTLGLPSMAYLNGQLEALAAREGISSSPLSPAWGVCAGLWPWRLLGVGLELITASGGIHGREFTSQTCRAIGFTLQGRINFPLFAQLISLTGAAGGYYAQASGLISGGGWGMGGQLNASGLFLDWNWARIIWKIGFRYLPVAAIQGRGGRIEPSTLPALDFTGFYLSIDFVWGG